MYDNKLKEKIKEKAVSLGITQSGFCKHNNKTAICFLFPYYKDEENSNLSIYARGLDYHKVARDMIEKILSPFTEDFEIFADIGPLDNIEVAKKSGLGVVGKNQLLINKELGSYFFIGYA